MAIPKMKANTRSVLYNEANILLKEFQARSPLDTGFYRSNWKIRKPRFASIGTISIGLINNDPKATVMEFGAVRNQAPWFYPNGTGKKRSKVKIVMRSFEFIRENNSNTNLDNNSNPGKPKPNNTADDF